MKFRGCLLCSNRELKHMSKLHDIFQSACCYHFNSHGRPQFIINENIYLLHSTCWVLLEKGHCKYMFSILSWTATPFSNSSICPWISPPFLFLTVPSTDTHYISLSLLPLFSPSSYVGRLHFPLQTINTSGNFLNLTNFPVGKGTPYITGLMLPQLIDYCRRKECTCSLQLLSLYEISLQRVHICIFSTLLGSVVWGPFLVGMLEDVYLSSLCMSV